MNKLYIEAKSARTAESCFIKAIVRKFCPDRQVEFVYMDGVSNLFNETILNIMRQSLLSGDSVIVLIDADTARKGWGYSARKKSVLDKMVEHDVQFPFFIYPDNSSDGDVEMIMESIAQKEKHAEWWDCFSDYENCISGVRTSEGESRYNMPNLKAKLHTFISSQQLSNAQRGKVGSGDWLFENEEYWAIDRMERHPLVNFLRSNLK